MGRFRSMTVEKHNQAAIRKLIEKGHFDIRVSVERWTPVNYGGLAENSIYVKSYMTNVDVTLRCLNDRILKEARETIQWVVAILAELQALLERNNGYTQGELEDVVDTLSEALETIDCTSCPKT